MLFLWIYKPPLRVSCLDTCRTKYIIQADGTIGTSVCWGEGEGPSAAKVQGLFTEKTEDTPERKITMQIQFLKS